MGFMIKMTYRILFFTGVYSFGKAVLTFPNLIELTFRSNQSLKHLKQRYGEGWVVVTGGSDGLGYEFADLLAKTGYKVCIVARNEEKLKSVTNQLSEKHKVQVQYIKHDFTDVSLKSLEKLEKNLNNLDSVSILINNVGIVTDLNKRFDDVELDSLIDSVKVNFIGPVMMTRILMKKFINQSHRSLVIDVSSMTADTDYNLSMIMYQATKSAFTKFSRTLKLQIEMENYLKGFQYYKTDIQIVKPSHFMSNMNPGGKNFWSENPKNIARITLQNTLNKRFETYGTKKHEILHYLLSSMKVYFRWMYIERPLYQTVVKDREKEN